MKHDYHLEFLRYKIAQTGTALCSFHIPGFRDISYIIHTTSVDESGNIYFSLADSLPENAFDVARTFRLSLFFFKKGLGYHLNIEASASAFKYAIDGIKESYDKEHTMLYVKAKIHSAEYVESIREDHLKTKGFLSSVKRKILQIAASIF